jgi:hypothetical protein
MVQLIFPVLMVAGFVAYYFLYYKPTMAKAQAALGSGDVKRVFGASLVQQKKALIGTEQVTQPVVLAITAANTLRVLENNGAGAVREISPKPRFELRGNVRQETGNLIGAKEEAYQMLAANGKFENARVVTLHVPGGEKLQFWMAESNAAALVEWSCTM